MRHMKLGVFLAILVVGSFVLMRAAATSTSVRGQDPNVTTRGSNTAGEPLVGTSGSNDATGGFVAQAAEMNTAESALAALAARNASDDDVRQFAAELERDHKMAAEELKALAANKHWAYPQSMEALQEQALQGLQQARGDDFDRAFVDAMIRAHEGAIREFRAAASRSADPDVRAFAQKQLPALEAHLTHAKQLR